MINHYYSSGYKCYIKIKKKKNTKMLLSILKKFVLFDEKCIFFSYIYTFTKIVTNYELWIKKKKTYYYISIFFFFFD